MVKRAIARPLTPSTAVITTMAPRDALAGLTPWWAIGGPSLTWGRTMTNEAEKNRQDIREGLASLRLCPGCRSLDGAHDFGPTCTIREESDDAAPTRVGAIKKKP